MTLSLQDIAKAMKDIDICLLTTTAAEDRGLRTRPMSNNRKVEYDGDSWFFANGDSSAVRDIGLNPEINLGFSHMPTLPPPLGHMVFLSVTGRAELIRDRAEMERHWDPDIEAWFKDGLDTPGLTLIKVRARHIHYWRDGDEGELTV
ncbi:pyridoxamine 5'-phosphate oxidase family protein [Asticcacaulis sp. AND118]|uniref:pyridoxamine 5'-phosphate oxidase family protein n=1 Tax=Asticcacaulis sp. AND118 TaxID=2840468 RepID=UPI001CFF9D71|nr:pyridoxamine 5'-phosphate oxidase family protein [Asticcacaulis sp. AND118]UDF03169.1 pyridoxamine 5'-phosphate oxidase family protein [Asticcacaulis sp. AND118]